jgi:hypothetical protein
MKKPTPVLHDNPHTHDRLHTHDAYRRGLQAGRKEERLEEAPDSGAERTAWLRGYFRTARRR